MPKYKYVDGVKYRVVPQSVLGYALVREDSDNSLPAGGTEGQVLAKASNTDYDVEWATVESGGGESPTFIIAFHEDNEADEYVLNDPTKIAEYYTNLEAGMIPILQNTFSGQKVFYTTSKIEVDDVDDHKEYTIYGRYVTAGGSGVTEYECEVFLDGQEYNIQTSSDMYPSAG